MSRMRVEQWGVGGVSCTIAQWFTWLVLQIYESKNKVLFKIIQNRGDYGGETRTNFTASWEQYTNGFGELQVQGYSLKSTETF